MYYIIYTLRFFYIYSIIAITLRLIQSTFLIVLSIHHLTMAYNFHTNSKHSESTLFKNFLSCIILSTVSNFQSKVNEMACTCNTRASGKKRKHRPRRLIWHDSRLSWLATRRLYSTDSLEKIKRFFALYCSTYWHTWYNKLQIKTNTLVHCCPRRDFAQRRNPEEAP